MNKKIESGTLKKVKQVNVKKFNESFPALSRKFLDYYKENKKEFPIDEDFVKLLTLFDK